jgi:N-acetyl-anhydromuramyl-L-alanine amidase AmpD
MTLTIKWVGPPRSYTRGRARQLRYVTLHYTAGSEGPTSAENGVAYDKTRTDGTSCHYFTDSLGPALCEVHDEDTSYSALYHGNALGIHIEICGTAQTRAQWLDAVSRATLQTTAELVAYLLKEHNLPNKRLSVAETRAAWYAPADQRYKYEGYNDHGTITAAYPEDGGTHTDVGPNFPWDVFSQMVTDAMEGDMADATVTGITKEGLKDFVKTDDAVPNLPWRSDYRPLGDDAPPTGPTGGTNQYIMWETWFVEMGNETLRQREALARIEAALAGGVEVAAVVGLTPEATQAVAEATADELHSRTES